MTQGLIVMALYFHASQFIDFRPTAHKVKHPICSKGFVVDSVLLWKKGLFYTSVEAIFSIHAMNENRSM
jgi:hypothetical protein